MAVHGNPVYVLNAGDGGSVQGFLRVGPFARSRCRPGTDGLNLRSDPPSRVHDSPGQVGLSPDGGKLLVTTKANGGAIDVFPVRGWSVPAPPRPS